MQWLRNFWQRLWSVINTTVCSATIADSWRDRHHNTKHRQDTHLTRKMTTSQVHTNCSELHSNDASCKLTTQKQSHVAAKPPLNSVTVAPNFCRLLVTCEKSSKVCADYIRKWRPSIVSASLPNTNHYDGSAARRQSCVGKATQSAPVTVRCKHVARKRATPSRKWSPNHSLVENHHVLLITYGVWGRHLKEEPLFSTLWVIA